jgi:uncharacterized membrane protein HdeD (DUF308 family)
MAIPSGLARRFWWSRSSWRGTCCFVAFDVVISLSNTNLKGWWLLLLAGIISFALGAWTIGNPDRSVLLLVTILGVYAIFHGVAELMFGFQVRTRRDELGIS